MTIKDIAKLSGVGVSTVSRVLNDRPDVSEESRRRVLEVIAEHNYLPNNSARSLVRTKSDTVGLVVRGVQNPFYTDIIRAIEHKLDLAGYTMVMRQIASGDDEVKCGAVMEREKRLQGLIFLGGRSDYSPAELALLNVPFVCCTYTNAYGTLDPSKYSSVSIADEQEAYRAVMELAKKGHRRIAALTADPDDSSISQLRYSGYARALRELGIPPEERGRFHRGKRLPRHARAAEASGGLHRRLCHRGRYGDRRDARPARERAQHSRGLLHHRHRRHQCLRVHPSHAHHPLPADDGYGHEERRAAARRHPRRRARPSDAADLPARG